MCRTSSSWAPPRGTSTTPTRAAGGSAAASRTARWRVPGWASGPAPWSASTQLAADAWELDLLVDAGVDLVRVPLPSGPVFHNHERPDGPRPAVPRAGHPVPVDVVPDGLARRAGLDARARGRASCRDSWADAAVGDARVSSLGWQGILRRLVAGERVTPLRPDPSALLSRADIVGVSRHDLERRTCHGTTSSAGCGRPRRCC